MPSSGVLERAPTNAFGGKANTGFQGKPRTKTARELKPLKRKHSESGAENNYLIVLSRTKSDVDKLRTILDEHSVPDSDKRIFRINEPGQLFSAVKGIVNRQSATRDRRIKPINNIGILDLSGTKKLADLICTRLARTIYDFQSKIENFYIGSSQSDLPHQICTSDKDKLKPINSIITALKKPPIEVLIRLASLTILESPSEAPAQPMTGLQQVMEFFRLNHVTKSEETPPSYTLEGGVTIEDDDITSISDLNVGQLRSSIFKPENSNNARSFLPFLEKVFNLTV